MKKLLVLLLAFITINAFGQSDKTVQEKERKFVGEGTIYLNSGDELNGKIRHSRVEDGYVLFYTEGVKKPKKYKVNDIVKFTIGDSILFVKVKSTTVTKLVQDMGYSDNKIKIYDATFQGNISVGLDPKKGVPTYIEYWAFFPGMKKAISIKDIMLSKKKVAKYVADCPDLSEKIANKEKGYKIGAIIPLNTLLETYKRISEEYEECN